MRARNEKRPGDARSRVAISPQQVRDLAAKMYTNAGIAAALGISHDTLERRMKEREYQEAFNAGRGDVSNKVCNWQLEAGSKLNPTVLIWLGKQLLGQKDIVEQHVTGADGGPLELRVIYRSPAPVIDVTPEPRQITNGHPSNVYSKD